MTPGKTVLTDLPIYAWRHDAEYWSESRVTREWRFSKFPHHELLGSRILEGNELEPVWRNMVKIEDVPWLRDHKIIEDIVFPAAGYIAMVGEAIKQISGTADYTLRHIVIKTALVMHESSSAEMITSLHPVRLTTTLDSVWFDFSIASYNGTTWTKHCVGQARAGSEHRPQSPLSEDMQKLPRRVSASAWYMTMKKLGLNYGPRFQGLTDVSAGLGPNQGTAVASVMDRYRESESAYQLHPTSIDIILQLFTVGVSAGSSRGLTMLNVPTNIEELYIRQGNPQMRVRVHASSNKKGTISADAVAASDGDIVLPLKGGEFSPLESQDTVEEIDRVAAAQLVWKRMLILSIQQE